MTRPLLLAVRPRRRSCGGPSCRDRLWHRLALLLLFVHVFSSCCDASGAVAKATSAGGHRNSRQLWYTDVSRRRRLPSASSSLALVRALPRGGAVGDPVGVDGGGGIISGVVDRIDPTFAAKALASLFAVHGLASTMAPEKILGEVYGWDAKDSASPLLKTIVYMTAANTIAVGVIGIHTLMFEEVSSMTRSVAYGLAVAAIPMYGASLTAKQANLPNGAMLVAVWLNAAGAFLGIAGKSIASRYLEWYMAFGLASGIIGYLFPGLIHSDVWKLEAGGRGRRGGKNYSKSRLLLKANYCSLITFSSIALNLLTANTSINKALGYGALSGFAFFAIAAAVILL